MPLSLRILERPEHVQSAIRAVSHPVIAQARTGARLASAKHFSKQTGAPALGPTAETAALDAHHAARAAEGLSNNWRKVFDRAILEEGLPPWEARGKASAALMANSVVRSAATEVADAINDETVRQAENLAARGHPDDNDPDAVATPYRDAPRVVLVWSAILDERTCTFCSGRHGMRKVLPDRFEVDPPVHPLCRCILLTEYK